MQQTQDGESQPRRSVALRYKGGVVGLGFDKGDRDEISVDLRLRGKAGGK